MSKKVTIVIPCYNHGIYIQDAIDSIEKVEKKELYHVIIVNDGSTDAYTIQKMAELESIGYQVINQKNQGLAMARNNGIAAANTPYILALDSDNKIRPNYIYKSIEAFEKDVDVMVCYGRAAYFGDRTGELFGFPFDKKRLLNRSCIDACSVFRKSIWEKIGGYDSKMPVMGYEDWDFYLSISGVGGKFHFIDEFTFDYRAREGSMIQDCHIPENQEALLNYIYTKHGRMLSTEYREMFKYYYGMHEKPFRFFVQLLIKKHFPNLVSKYNTWKKK